MQGLIGKKVGMTRIIDQETGVVLPVTVIEAQKNIVLQEKTVEKDGYSAVQLGYEKVADKKLTKAEIGHAKKHGSEPVKYVKEFQLDADETVEPGQEIGVEIFDTVSYVNVTGVTKGRGFAGTVKRHGFKIGRATHGNTNRRARGSLGAGSSPSRVFPGLKMAGQYGNTQKTVKGLEIVSIDAEKNLIYVNGAVPGRKGGLLYIKKNLVKN